MCNISLHKIIGVAVSLISSSNLLANLLQVLGAKKPLVVVVNDQLMDNHQTELAERLAQDNHCVHCVPSTLAQTLADFKPDSLTPFPPGNPKAFADFVDKLF